jgi:hypothetical protein
MRKTATATTLQVTHEDKLHCLPIMTIEDAKAFAKQLRLDAKARASTVSIFIYSSRLNRAKTLQFKFQIEILEAKKGGGFGTGPMNSVFIHMFDDFFLHPFNLDGKKGARSFKKEMSTYYILLLGNIYTIFVEGSL